MAGMCIWIWCTIAYVSTVDPKILFTVFVNVLPNGGTMVVFDCLGRKNKLKTRRWGALTCKVAISVTDISRIGIGP
jgi:hypothetical protein